MLSAGMYVCTFQPGHFTGCSIEGVKVEAACPLLTWWGICVQDEVMGPAMQEASLPGLLLQGLENTEPDLWSISWYVEWTWRICALCAECPTQVMRSGPTHVEWPRHSLTGAPQNKTKKREEICKAPTLQLKVLNKHNTHNVHQDGKCYLQFSKR